MAEVGPHITHFSDWSLILLLSLAVGLVLFFRRDREQYRPFWRLPLYTKAREWSSAFNPFKRQRLNDLWLATSGFLTLGLAILLLRHAHQLEKLPLLWPDYLRILLLLAGVFLVKNLLSSLTGSVFAQTTPLTASQNIQFAYLSWLQLPLWPLCLLMLLWPEAALLWSYLLGGTIALGVLSGWMQSARVTLFLAPHLGYNIFYLCTLEISPVAYLLFILKSV